MTNKKFETDLRISNVKELTDEYRLNFIGKDYAKRQARERPTSVILPDEVHNDQAANKDSKNLFFTGDNLEVLRHLRQNYANSVDFIYIDPPYNTGSDGFVYPDSFQVTGDMLTEFDVVPNDKQEVKEFKERYDQQGKKSHSAWLTFMYPRLVLARKLLKDDGVIFVSIDDNEQANLKLMLDDVWVRDLDYVNQDRYKKQDEFVAERVKYYLDTLDRGGLQYSGSMNYGIETPDGGIIYPNGRDAFENDGWIWKWGKEKVAWGLKNNFLEFVPSDKSKESKYTLKYKVYQLVDKEGKQRENVGRAYTNLITNPINQQGKSDLQDLFDGVSYFTNPKPVNLITKFLSMIKNKNGLIFDFFAGSATTADAVMQSNKADSGDRQYIMVQLPEKLSDDSAAARDGFKTIDEISRARIEKVAEKIGDASGYKHFTVKNVQADTLDKLEKFDPHVILADNMISNIPGGVDTLLTTGIMADGYKFDELVEKKSFGHGTGYYVTGSVFYIFENTWDSEATKQLLNELEQHSFNLNTIIVSEYALIFEAMTELKTNIKTLKDKDFDIQVEVRN